MEGIKDEDTGRKQPADSGLRPRRAGGLREAIEFHRDREARRAIATPHSSDGLEGAKVGGGAGNSEAAGPQPADGERGVEGRAITFPQPAQAAKDSPKKLSTEGGSTVRAVRRGDDAQELAKNLFREIGKRFNENRRKSKSAAYETYQKDLMENIDTLVLGGVIDLKEITSAVTNLEAFMRSDVSEHGKSPAMLLADWLKAPVSEFSTDAETKKKKKS